MGLSNKFNWLVLTTGNKSEMATGLLDALRRHGRGVRPLKDVEKTLVYRLARWRNRDGTVIPDHVLEKAAVSRASPPARSTPTPSRPTTCSTRSWRDTLKVTGR